MILTVLNNLDTIFAWILEASWQASVVVVLVLLFQWILGHHLNPRWYHALWLLVIVRLVLPFSPESSVSLFQFAPPAPPVITQSLTEPFFIAVPIDGPTQPLSQSPTSGSSFSVWTILAVIWLSGAIALGSVTWVVNRRFYLHLKNAAVVDDAGLLDIAAKAKCSLGLRGHVQIIESAQIQGPAIMGLFCPTLILPQGVRSKFSDGELRFIFLHEFAHLKRGDLMVQWLVAVLQMLHWFNPVLWYAFRLMRADRESATDALVLSCEGEAQRQSYGHVLVKLMEQIRARHFHAHLTCMLEDKDQFKRRFLLIGNFTRGAYSWSVLGAFVIVALAVVCLTSSKTPRKMSQAEARQKGIAALVNQKPIYWTTVDQQVDVAKNSLSEPDLKKKIADARTKVLSALIDRELILDIDKTATIHPSKRWIDDVINGTITTNYGGDRKAFLKSLSDRGADLSVWVEEFRERCVVAYCLKVFVSEKVKDYYFQNPQLFPEDEQLNITIIGIRGAFPVSPTGVVRSDPDPQSVLAGQILQQIRAGADAASIAKKYHELGEFGSAGVPYWVSQNGPETIPPRLPFNWESVAAMKVGQTTEVLTANQDYIPDDDTSPIQKYPYYYIVRLNDRHPATRTASTDPQQSRAFLLQLETEKVRKEWLDSLRGKAQIQRFDLAEQD